MPSPKNSPIQLLSSEDPLSNSIQKASSLILSQQFPEGYWWYTLEANESINAEFILLTHYLGCPDPNINKRIAERILSQQRPDGSWSLYFEGSGDISSTLECYLALKMTGYHVDSEPLAKARNFILSQGGLTRCRIFTRIHLALFGLVPWNICPHMPVGLIQLPAWFPINIYEFSSWARACIVPLLVIMDQKKANRTLPPDFLDDLYLEQNPADRNWSYHVKGQFLSTDNFFVQLDALLGKCDQWSLKPFHKSSLQKCESWIREHILRTEDIYPALAYAAMALYSLGYPVTDPTIQKCLKALRSFQIRVDSPPHLYPLPKGRGNHEGNSIYQQCCISPVWDTPWVGTALLEAGQASDSHTLMKSARWLESKQITTVFGDWAQKNKKGVPGGWSFEFENDFFPDVDDTIQVLNFLIKLDTSNNKFKVSVDIGLQWILSMQSSNGGWGAFDLNNTKEWVNRIPFSDHGACLDPPTPDITGRAIELLAQFNSKSPLPPFGKGGHRGDLSVTIRKAIKFIEKTQESWGPWWGRWGVNYIYGTWSVLQGLNAIGYDMKSTRIGQAVDWLKSVQHEDGGFGESCHSYLEKKFIPLPSSVASQTAWALMALIAAGEGKSKSAQKAAAYLINNQQADGSWEERHHTGTGFPGHFYIRYHGYRYYFPLLALVKYRAVDK